MIYSDREDIVCMIPGLQTRQQPCWNERWWPQAVATEGNRPCTPRQHSITDIQRRYVTLSLSCWIRNWPCVATHPLVLVLVGFTLFKTT